MLRANAEATELSFAVGQVLQYISALVFANRWIVAALNPHGLAVSQVGVEEAFAANFKVAWRRFGRVFVPTYGTAVALEGFGGTIAQQNSIRILFLCAMLSVVAFGVWIQRNRYIHFTGVTHAQRARRRTLPFAFLILPAISLFGLSAFGYHYTAVELSRSCLITAVCVIGSITLYLVALRWLRIAAARLEVKYAPELIAATMRPEDVRRELNRFNAQAKLILRNVIGWSLAVGLFWVWRDALPALTIFDRVSLWEIELKDPAGATRMQPITIVNMALAVIIGIITTLAARNVPGVIEVGVLQRFRVHHGSRYAITSLLRYSIVAVGLSVALSTLGLRWSQIQWLVAALGVGLGFGLQEIFANFISGLILLFERPVRVGDVVTIGDLTGKVSRIQIRATTITDADNKEIIVPNKTFITERFLNWTLSDQISRVVISVGIAYGADTKQAMRLLLDAAYAHPKVMREPPPQAVLTGFGDNALLFELQVFAEELGHRADVRHDLNTEIYRTFTAHGIEIPFPQRDLRIRSIDAASGGLAPPPGPQRSATSATEEWLPGTDSNRRPSD
ncbi:MAG: mechanosensitive ion channel domain-containing protein [Gammaproteobacteria bacterium]